MNVLFLGYWGANEGLSQSTINPHLEILSLLDNVDNILYVSMERSEESSYHVPRHSKIQHIPYRSVNKVLDFLILPLKLSKYIKQYRVDLMMCRSSLAGSIGHLTTRLVNIPYTVESFEPHADYMLELSIWSSTGLIYKVQHYLEQKQKKAAHHLMPVSNNYKVRLIEEGVTASRLSVLPCAVDHKKFSFDAKVRAAVREHLNISPNTIVGIYVGKFGDLYLDKEAFQLFKSAYDFFDSFHLILLNPEKQQHIKHRCQEVRFPIDQIHHHLVSHKEVPLYLSASDFAFSLHRPTIHSFAFSPIKNGEYWANGLPIVSMEGIGDDSEIIDNEKGGLIINSLKQVNWFKLNQLIEPNRSPHIAELSKKYRNLQIVIDNYKALVKKEKSSK